MAAVSLDSSVAVNAHEAGTTHVIASFTANRRYAIELTTDASTLLARLEAARKQPQSSPATIADYRRGFAGLCDEIGRHLAASFDGTRAPVAPACTVDDAVSGPEPSLASLGVTVRFDGSIPAGAKRFTWQYTLTYATYTLTIVSSDGHADETMSLEGGEVSRAAELDRVAAPVVRRGFVARYFSPRIHARPAQGARSPSLRAGPLPAQPSCAGSGVAARRVQPGTFHRVRLDVLRRDRIPVLVARAALGAVHRLRRSREHRHIRAEAMAHRAGVRLWSACTECGSRAP